jgi:hypothetical protein
VIDPAVSGIAPAAAIVQAVLEIAQAWVIDPAVSGIARAGAIVQVLGAAEQTAEAAVLAAEEVAVAGGSQP